MSLTVAKPSPPICPQADNHLEVYDDVSDSEALDNLDRIAILAIDPKLVKARPEIFTYDEAEIASTARDLARQGGRGTAARRILAGDVATAKTLLRYYEALLTSLLRRVCHGSASEKQVKALERAVSSAHRRMLASMEALARLDSPAPAIHVSNQTAVIVGGVPR